MTIFNIPTKKGIPSYELSIVLDGVNYFLLFRYNGRMKRWVLDIFDDTRTLLLAGMLIRAQLDIFYQYYNPGIPKGLLFGYNIDGTFTPPEFGDLGDNTLLLYEDSP